MLRFLAERPNLQAALALFAVVLLANAPAVTGWLNSDPLLVLSHMAYAGRDGLLPGTPGWTDPNTGTTTEALGRLSAEMLLRGEMPWWNPYSGVGLPLAAVMQSISLFLPFVLLLTLPRGMLLLKISMQLIAGYGTWSLLRRLGLGRMAALAGAILFALNGSFGWQGAYAPALPPAFLPWILLGVEHATDAARARCRGGVALLALALAWSLYAGFPETAYVDGLLAAAWSVLRIAEPAGAGRRLAVLLRIALGGTLGLLLAAPILLPFAEYLRDAGLAVRGLGFATFPFPSRFTALFLFPHLFGLPGGLWVWDRDRLIQELFALNGGWIGASLTLLALIGALGGAPQRGLRRLLLAWLIVNLLKTMAVPGVTGALNLVPGVPLIAWFHYAPPSWEMAAAVLAAFALEDWRQRRLRLLWPALGGVLLLAGAVLMPARPVLASLLSYVPHYALFIIAALGEAVVTLAAVTAALTRPPRARWPAVLLVAATMESFGLFLVPLLAGRRDIRLDTGTVPFLQDNLGLQRFVSWDSLQANYGAYWRIASINYEYVPVPDPWYRHVATHLDPAASIFAWRGSVPRHADGVPFDSQALQALVADYEADGVKYVVAQTGNEGFNIAAGPPPTGPRHAIGLPPEGWLAGTLASPTLGGGRLRSAGVLIGTFGGVSTGRLELVLCAGSKCTAGTTELRGKPDNASLPVTFDRELEVRAGEKLRWRIIHRGGDNSVAVWLDADPPGTAPDVTSPWGPQAGQLRFSFNYAGSPRLVHEGPAAQVWELPDPKPYFEASPGPCRLEVRSRTRLDALCEAPAVLLRRELFFPGWTARVNDATSPIARAHELFQEIELPRGPSRIRFSYAPPFVWVAYGLFALGVAGLVQSPLRRARRSLSRESLRAAARQAIAGARGSAAAAWKGVLAADAAVARQARRPGFWAGVLIGFAALTAARIPTIWPYGRLWAEEGVVYLANAWTAPWYKALFTVHTGYLNLPASAATTLAVHFVPLSCVPLFTTLVALVIQLCPPVLLMASGIAWLRDWRVLMLALLAILLPPFADEVWLNTITSQFHIMLALAIILAAPPGRGGMKWFSGTILLLAPISGPGGAMLLPLYGLRAWLDRSRPRLFQALLLLPGVLAQAAIVLTHPEHARMVGLHLPIVLAAITNKQIIMPLSGDVGLQWLTPPWQDAFAAGGMPLFPVLAPLVVFAALGVAAWRSNEASIRWLFVACVTLMLASYLAALTPDGPVSLLGTGSGNRYYFAPASLTGLVVLGVTVNGPRICRVPAAIMITWLLVIGAREYPRAGQFFRTGPQWPAEVAAWRADPTHPIGIWPTGWGVPLPNAP
jgi:heme exporter protein D